MERLVDVLSHVLWAEDGKCASDNIYQKVRRYNWDGVWVAVLLCQVVVLLEVIVLLYRPVVSLERPIQVNYLRSGQKR